MEDVIRKLMNREDLSAEEATRAMTGIMTGDAGEARTAAILVALALKGETGVEIESFARAMRHAAVRWPGGRSDEICDTCGTGGDASNTLNISTLSAIVLASMGVPVAKHGNRAVSSTTGSADLLEELGMPMNLDPDDVLRTLEKSNLCFLFAPMWHPAMKHAAPVRKALGVRTVFNLLGPLTNPAPISYQVVGVFSRHFMPQIASALAGLRRRGAYVVHSEEGWDEVSPSGATHAIRIDGGQVTEEQQLTPEDFGFAALTKPMRRITNRSDAVRRSRALLAGEGEDAENQVVAMNAALIYSMVKGLDLRSASEACLEHIRSGNAGDVVQSWSRQ